MNSGENNTVSTKDEEKMKKKGQKRASLAASGSFMIQAPRQLTREENKSYEENGFVLVRGVLSDHHIRSMQREIEILKMKYERENRSCEEESCTLDPFVDSTIPETSPARVSMKSYLTLRRQSLDLTMKGDTTNKEIKAKDGEEQEITCSLEDEDSGKRKRAKLITATNNLFSGTLADSCRLHPGSAAEVVLQIFPALCSQLMKGNRAYLFNENYIVKPANSTLSFAWHKDAEEQLGMWFKANTMQYISVWCALDRMDDSNGTLVFGSEGLEESKNLRIECEVGDCVLFHSSRIHSSGPNRSLRERRVAYAQYTPEPFLVGSKNETPLSFAIRCC